MEADEYMGLFICLFKIKQYQTISKTTFKVINSLHPQLKIQFPSLNSPGDVLQYVPSLLYASGRTTAVVMEEAEQQQDTDLYRRCKGGAGGG